MSVLFICSWLGADSQSYGLLSGESTLLVDLFSELFMVGFVALVEGTELLL